MRLADEGDGVAAVTDADIPVLTTSMVRDTFTAIEHQATLLSLDHRATPNKRSRWRHG
jgi:hypothetical protein